ncbi:GNAT family N-acetyltransferase [Mariniblastus fucicola]|uniref:N-acetyltransferase domain-containing protein n=1 Tax=Mariniblastus fucicola TaxID=980251 RepID=A0A5B9PH09_9BACT|nr:GNAT family N-acetyltransferase [Mariniblastus fucicola]QEG24052.1 hypothetical protein MFFC18_39680 [Mariniblastus fucicola]
MSEFEIAAYDLNECLLCRRDGKVVGQVNVRDLRDESFGGYVIWNLLVFPGNRNEGVGEALVECVLQNFDDAPAFITADPFHDDDGMNAADLTAWYRRLGFKVWNDEANVGDKWMIREPWQKNEPAEE